MTFRPRTLPVRTPAPRARPACRGMVTAALALAGAACGPVAHVPQRPHPSALAADTGAPAALARQLAPLLLQHPDERFPLERVLAVVHPARRVIAYHLLWRDDAFGAWIPRTIPTDQEIVWVGYDPSGAPAELWTYWHGRILHAEWPGRQVAVGVQWGKHGSLPLGTRDADLPAGQTLRDFWAYNWMAVPDLLLGKLQRPGPGCFCAGPARYGQFTRPLFLADRLDAVVVTADPRGALRALFGTPYSEKPLWPWLARGAIDPVPVGGPEGAVGHGAR